MHIIRPVTVLLALVLLSACSVGVEPGDNAGTATPTLDAGGSHLDRDAGSRADGGRAPGDDAGSDDDAGADHAGEDDAGDDVGGSAHGDAGSDAGSASLCDDVDCGAGACVDEAGAAQCVCPANLVGAACEECADGYEAFEDTCVVVGCGGVDCGAHGECVAPSEVSAGGCECEAGYDGDECELCAEGHVLVGELCVPDACDQIECVNGDCLVDGTTPSCECSNGFIGESCDTCPLGYLVRPSASGPACRLWLPISDGVRAWFDGAPPYHRVTRDPDNAVSLWFSGMESPVAYVAPFGDNAAATYLEEERGLRFNGEEQRMSSYPNHFKDTTAYTAYFVVSWNPAAGHQFVWGTTDQSAEYGGNGPLGFAVEILANGDVRARHNGTFAPNAGDVVIGDFYEDTGAPQLIRVQWGPLLNGHVLTISNGNQTATAVSTTGAFTLDTALNRVGRNVIEGQGLDGLLHEVILVDRALGTSERTLVEDYLRVKWQLP